MIAVVNADDTSQESNNDSNAANRDRIQAEKAGPRGSQTEEQKSAGNYSAQVKQTKIDRRLKKTKLYSADTVKAELAQSAMPNADRTSVKQEEQHVQQSGSGEMKAIGAAENISNQVRQARTNRQLKKTLLYSSYNSQNSNTRNADSAVPNAVNPNAAIPNAAIPNAAFPSATSASAAFPIFANSNAAIPSSVVPSSAIPSSAAQHPIQEAQHAKQSGFNNDVESEIEPSKIQARPRQQSRPESRGRTSSADFEGEERGTNNRNRRESTQDFQTEAPKKQNLVVSLVVLVLLVIVGAFVLISQFHFKGNAPDQQSPAQVRASSKPAGPMYYTGMQVSFNPDQVPMTMENMQEYNSTKISDEVCLFVASVLPNSPAGKVNLQLGARVVSIDGESLNGLTIEQVQGRLEGESNSTVKISVRTGLKPEQTFALLRQVPVNPAAVGKDTKK